MEWPSYVTTPVFIPKYVKYLAGLHVQNERGFCKAGLFLPLREFQKRGVLQYGGVCDFGTL